MNHDWLNRFIRRCIRIFAVLALLGAITLPVPGYAQSPLVAVLYPDVGEPFLGVFMDIIHGIEERLKRPVRHYTLNNDTEAPAAFIERLKADQIEAVIALGRGGVLTAKPLAVAFPVVIGATTVAPSQETQGLAGISLTPDPDFLFDRLREIVPGVQGVTVVYDPRQKAWEIERARLAAERHKLALTALPAEDIRSAALYYRDVLIEIKDGSIAVWLPRDNAAMDERTLLPVILKEAWEKNFVIFSGNLEHVRKGALLSFYPDNFAMGRSLANLALNRLQSHSTDTSRIEPLRDLLVAVNMRTAEHLGLSFSSETKRKFDLMFPSP